MRKIICFLILIILFYLVYNNRENLVKIYSYYFIPIEDKITKLEKNQYYRDYNFQYVQNTNNFIPQKKEEILNIYYTVINSGMKEFTFYCPKEYLDCIDDINDIANNQKVISNINNFVHPFNSFKTLNTEVEATGKITLSIDKVYNDEMIIILNYKIDEIIKNNIVETSSNREKIKVLHDYIINHTSYDKKRSDEKITNYKSDNAYGVLIEGYGLCGGYTDAMMLFLDKLGIPNIKISTENHTWNYLKIDDQWLHLDLTWDDPVSDDDKNILDHSYFLINDTELKNLEIEEHNYDTAIFQQ